MTPEEFANGACKSGILSKQKIADLLLHFTTNDESKVRFPTDPRVPIDHTIWCCSRFRATCFSGPSLEKRQSIQFSVDKAISVVGFGLYGGRAAREDDIHTVLFHNEDVLRQKGACLCSDGTANIIDVMFGSPVRIQADTYYTATLFWKDSTIRGIMVFLECPMSDVVTQMSRLGKSRTLAFTQARSPK